MRRTLAALAAAMLCSAPPGSAQTAEPNGVRPSADTLRQFAVPHRLVDVGGGRRINLFCMGTGAPTVLFDSGGSDWSVIWGLVQPEVARRTRACSYDRAGLGYSDAAAGPRSPAAVADDLAALIAAAGLEGPLVLVGHSLGGFNVKLFAALHPERVAGMVLVDPSEDRGPERVRERLRRRFGDAVAARLELGDADWMQRLVAHYQGCAAEAAVRDLDPASLNYRRCSDPARPALGPEVAAERARIQVTRRYQEAQASEIANSVYADGRGDAVYRAMFVPGRLGTRPLVVLTHGTFDAADPVDAADHQSYVWLHEETAALSRRGRHRVVPGTSHNIEIDDPGAVTRAVGEVLDALGHRPAGGGP